jgi:hypothetical protein
VQVPPFSNVSVEPRFVDVRGVDNHVSVSTGINTNPIALYNGSAASTEGVMDLSIQTDSAGKAAKSGAAAAARRWGGLTEYPADSIGH